MHSRTSRFVTTAAAAFALLVALIVPANAQWAIGGMLTLQSQDRQHELTLQTKLAMNARFGDKVIGAAHFGAIPSVTDHVGLDFLLTPDNFEFRDARNDFGFVTFIPVTGPEVCERLRPHYSDTKSQDRRQPDSFRFSLPAGSLQPAMTYSVKMTLNLAKSSRTFVVFFKRGTQKGDVSFSLNVRDVQAPQNAFDAFKQLDGFSLLIDDQPGYNLADGNGQQNDGRVPNEGSDNGVLNRILEEQQKTNALLGEHADKLSALTSRVDALEARPVQQVTPPTPEASKASELGRKTCTIEVVFRNADGSACFAQDGEARVNLDGRDYCVNVVSGKGEVCVDLNPIQNYRISVVMRLRASNGRTSRWSACSVGSFEPAKYAKYQAACNWRRGGCDDWNLSVGIGYSRDSCGNDGASLGAEQA
jgi:hypothetical protein